MAQAVVDVLEPIEVDEEHRDLGAHPGAVLQRLIQAVEKQRPVRQPGHRVVISVAHRFDRARVGQGKARLLGERCQHLAPVVDIGRLGKHDRHETADRLAFDVHRRG